jgi:hypothetical protein
MKIWAENLAKSLQHWIVRYTNTEKRFVYIYQFIYVPLPHLKVHKREKFLGSDFEFFTIL